MESKKFKILVVGVMVITLSCITLWSEKMYGQEKYPSKPIEVVIPFSAGGPTDVWTRIVADELSKDLGVPISILYKPGAGGVTGTVYITTRKPDGYTLLAATGSFISAPQFEKVPHYDVLKDFTPIAECVTIPMVLLSHTSSNLTSFDAMLKLAKEKPGELTCATAGVGTTAHLVVEVFKMHGVDFTHVPMKGGAVSITSLLGKHVNLILAFPSHAIPHVRSGDVRFLATTDKILGYPGVPTFKEKGLPECDIFSSWQGFFGPGNLPKPIRDQLANSLQKVIQIPSVVKALENAGFSVEYRGPDELEKKVANDYKDIEKVVKAAGLGKYAK